MLNLHSLFGISHNLYSRTSRALYPIFPIPPLLVRIRLTNRCNLGCHFCFARNKADELSPPTLTAYEWLKVLQHLPRWSVLDITGGEPLLADSDHDRLRAILSSRHKAVLITNGTLLDSEVARIFIKNRLFVLMFSLDGLAESHDKIRGSGTFAQVLRNLKMLNALKKQTGTNYPLLNAKITLTGKNTEELLPLCRQLFEEAEVTRFTFNLLFENQARGGNPLACSLDSASLHTGNTLRLPREAIENLKGFRYFLPKISALSPDIQIQLRPHIPLKDVELYFLNPDRFYPNLCNAPWSTVTIYGNGTVAPCDLALGLSNLRDFDLNLTRLVTGKHYSCFLSDFRTQERSIPACQACCLVPNHFHKKSLFD